MTPPTTLVPPPYGIRTAPVPRGELEERPDLVAVGGARDGVRHGAEPAAAERDPVGQALAAGVADAILRVDREPGDRRRGGSAATAATTSSSVASRSAASPGPIVAFEEARGGLGTAVPRPARRPSRSSAASRVDIRARGRGGAIVRACAAIGSRSWSTPGTGPDVRLRRDEERPAAGGDDRARRRRGHRGDPRRHPVRTGRFMASRLVALVEHPALEDSEARVEVETRRRMTAGERTGRGRKRSEADQLALCRSRGRRRSPGSHRELIASRHPASAKARARRLLRAQAADAAFERWPRSRGRTSFA